MTQLIYYITGISLCAIGVFVMLRRRDALTSIEWLNGYALKKMVPPRHRVNFDSITTWFAFNTLLFFWMVSAVFLVDDMAIVATFVIHVILNYLISRMKGGPRVRLTLYKTWVVVIWLSAVCWYRLWSVLHQ